MDIKEIIENSKLTISKEKIKYNESMAKYTTFKIGGKAQCLINVENKEQLKEIIQIANKNQIEITIIGNGSNILILDNGIKGITIKINLDKYKIKEKGTTIEITAEAGCKLGQLAQIFLKNEIQGFEELSGIPGTLGGAIKMNAGAYGKEIKDIIEEVTAIDYQANERIFKKEELELGYRTSIFKKEKYIITQAKINLTKGNKEQIKNKMTKYSIERKQKQPIECPNAGSTFKRGDNFITAKLIDEAGLKGYTIGGAMVSTKHSGFIINKGNATAKDVTELIKYVQEQVNRKFNKKIELEIEIIGE